MIDISTETFSNLLPSVSDMRFLAHVRQVSTGNKEPLANAPHDGWFSTVIANRFSIPPAPGTAPQRNIVHLVSLEGLEPYLNPSSQPPPAAPLSNFQRSAYFIMQLDVFMSVRSERKLPAADVESHFYANRDGY